jgi:hypothetical protein
MFMKPYQLPHPPIGVAGVTPNSEMYKLAGTRGWMPMSLNLVPISSLQRNWQTYAGRVCSESEPIGALASCARYLHWRQPAGAQRSPGGGRARLARVLHSLLARAPLVVQGRPAMSDAT